MIDRINIIPSAMLDKARWDKCIATSPNGFVYATSIYLDTMATNWDAMVAGDYDRVMPLPWRKKSFIRYIYPPAFIQQLGIFSPRTIPAEDVTRFIEAIPPKYKYCEMHFNYANTVNNENTRVRKNYLLSLTPGYELLREGYSRSAKRNIAKAVDAGITIHDNAAANEIIALHRKRFVDSIGATAEDYQHFETLCHLLQQKGQCITAGAYNSNNSVIAGSIYFKYGNRLTFILNGNTAESLTCGATHLLKDHVIQKFAGSGLTLDFEGSDIENFARFYEQFGAAEAEHYTTLILNRLPFLLRFLK